MTQQSRFKDRVRSFEQRRELQVQRDKKIATNDEIANNKPKLELVNTHTLTQAESIKAEVQDFSAIANGITKVEKPVAKNPAQYELGEEIPNDMEFQPDLSTIEDKAFSNNAEKRSDFLINEDLKRSAQQLPDNVEPLSIQNSDEHIIDGSELSAGFTDETVRRAIQYEFDQIRIEEEQSLNQDLGPDVGRGEDDLGEINPLLLDDDFSER